MGVLKEFEENSRLRVSVEKSKAMVSQGVASSTKVSSFFYSSCCRFRKIFGLPIISKES